MNENNEEKARKRMKLSLNSRKCLRAPGTPVNPTETSSSARPNCAFDMMGMSKTTEFTVNHEDQEQMLAAPQASPQAVATLRNMGNTCYLNGLLYALRCLVEFRSHLHELASKINAEETASSKRKVTVVDSETSPSTEASICIEIHKNMRKTELDDRLEHFKKSLCPEDLLDTLRMLNPEYDANRQHDVHELMGYLLDSMEKVREKFSMQKGNARRRSKKIISKGESDELFHGKLLLRTRCMECENVVESEDTFWDISVPLSQTSLAKSQNHNSLASLLKSEETLRDDNKVFCQVCFQQNEAFISTHFARLPKVLILRAKQTTMAFSSSSECAEIHKANGKITVPLEVPCLLDCHSNNSHESSPLPPCVIHEYSLRSVICHVGSTYSSGHYTTYVHSANFDKAALAAKKPPAKKDETARTRTKTKSKDYATCCGPVDQVHCAATGSNNWLHFDDDKVTVLDSLPVFDTKYSTAMPYLLFYRSKSV